MSWSKNLDWSSYYKIPDELCELYLERLQIKRKAPSIEYLNELIKANQTIIPFENLDTTLWNQSVSIEPEKLIDKILIKKRGGFCFELNGIFEMFLRSLGFNSWMCLCRQLMHTEPCPVPATHCAILVYLNGKEYFCDVGYGGPVPEGSMELKLDSIQTVGTEQFYFKKSGIVQDEKDSDEQTSGWLTLVRKSSDIEKNDLPLMRVAPIHCYLSDFYGQSLLRSEGDSAFSILHVTRKTMSGYIDLTDRRLRIKDGNRNIEYQIDDETLPEILLQYFGIRK